MQFLDILDSSLSEAELSALCRQFGVAYGAFPGVTRRDKIREFLGYVQRHGRTAGLAEATAALRPDLAPAVARLFEGDEEDLAWIDELMPGDAQIAESGLTWRRSSSAAVTRSSSGQSVSKSAPSPIDVPNPYTPGLAVRDEAMFFGREVELDLLARHLVAGQHVAIIGGRTLGGSSLLYRASRRLAGTPRTLVAYIDLKDPAHQTPAGLFDAAWRQWWARVKPGDSAHIRTLPDFVTAVRKLNAAGYRPALFLDELEQLAWRPSIFTDDLFETWRALGDGGQLGFALTGHASPADILAQNGLSSRFYELFQPLNLGLLEAAAARDMLAVPLERAGLEPSSDAVDTFVDRAGPHPLFLQVAGHYLFDALARHTYSRSEVGVLFTIAAEPFWQELWDSMTPLAQEHYPATPSLMDAGMAGRQQRILANKGLAIVEGGSIRPFSAGFADWLSRMQAAVEAAGAIRSPATGGPTNTA